MDKKDTVRDIGGHKELFIDEAAISILKGVRLRMNPPYQDHEPVFEPEMPWEYRIHPYATVLREGDTFRLWYLAYEFDAPLGVELPVPGSAEDNAGFWLYGFWKYVRARLCYAESGDGVHWTRPNLGLVDFKGSRENNILGPSEHDDVGHAGWLGGTVFKDPAAAPEKRYRLWSQVTLADRQRSGLWAFHSPDGLRWTPDPDNPMPGSCDCLNVVFRDDRTGQYVGYSRVWNSDDQADQYRAVRRLVSADFIHWEDEGIVIEADEVDLSLPVNRRRQSRQIVDYHGNCAFRYPDTLDAYLALPEMWWHWGSNPFSAEVRDQEWMGGFPDKADIQLHTSRDGIHWERAGDRLPFLRLGPRGSADSKMIYAFTQPLPVGDELWIYYGGFRYGISEKVALKRGAYFRARLRLDGFISADAPYTGGKLVTRQLRFSGGQLLLNADTSAGGAIRVEIQDVNGVSIEGYSLGQADELNGNSVQIPVTWQGQSDVRKLAGKVVSLRFVMRCCKLYSFQFVDI